VAEIDAGKAIEVHENGSVNVTNDGRYRRRYAVDRAVDARRVARSNVLCPTRVVNESLVLRHDRL
jgi:hypothetical protein